MNRRERRAAAPNSPQASNAPGAVSRAALEHAAQARPDSLFELGSALRHQGRPQDALVALRTAVQLQPGNADAWAGLGGVLADLGHQDHALSSFQQALKLDPQHWEAAQQGGALLYRLGRWQEALIPLRQCLDAQPNHTATLVMCTGGLFSLRRFEDVVAINLRAYTLDPQNADICNSIAVALQLLGREAEALPWFDRAIGIRPDFIDALNNRAVALSQMHRFDEACATYARVKALDPGSAAEWNLSLLQLLTGNFEAGWAGREARWKAGVASYPTLTGPRWFGEDDIDGKTILVCADEGLGDTIQFARYLPMVAARGARVILAVDNAVRPLLSELPEIALCVAKSALPLPACDMHCPMSGLPLAFGTRLDTIPSAPSYLPAPPARAMQAWRYRLGPHDRLRIGLVWSGNPQHGNDHNRSIPLQMFSRLLDLDARFISLQKDPRPADQAVLGARPEIVDLTAHLTDFVETAALIGCLDMVISVDTSVAHLAAALGCPTWVLLPHTPDYRWLLGRDDSPWYPTVRLFRQTETRDYGSVLDRVRTELQGSLQGGLQGQLQGQL